MTRGKFAINVLVNYASFLFGVYLFYYFKGPSLVFLEDYVAGGTTFAVLTMVNGLILFAFRR
jgi:hypothetical protein